MALYEKEMKTDILIPLGKGSRYNNIELKYCLRSVEKYLTGVGNIFIVGELPDFINPETVIHIPLKDNPNNWERAHNIYRKIMAGINYKGVVGIQFTQDNEDFVNDEVTCHVDTIELSDNFLFMNDDHFLLTDYRACEFPYYHRGPIDLEMMKNNRPQFMQYQNTKEFLSGYETEYFLDFGIHCPIVYNKSHFESIFYGVPWTEHGFEIKSCYSNILDLEYVEIEDLKFKEPVFMKESIYQALEGRPWFSIGDRVLKNGVMQQVLNELYPNPSKYEL
jgi:hypothetical protein